MTSLALVNAAMSAERAKPQRELVRAFLNIDEGTPTGPAGGTRGLRRSLADATIEIDRLSCVHARASHATPADVTVRWSGRRGLAVAGPNGAGKSTLALALLGLVSPTSGEAW